MRPLLAAVALAAAPVLAEAPGPCAAWPSPALAEGPVTLGVAEADLGTGRRVCPRTEVGLGARLGATIDTPDFYGAIRADGHLFGAWAVRPDTELFATLEAVTFNFAQNAVLTATRVTLGHLTVGASRVHVARDTWALAANVRALLPTSFELPGARLLGAELGATTTWRPRRWLEVHGALGGRVTGAVGQAAALPAADGLALAGVQLSPFSWGGLAVDVAGRLGAVSSLTPSVALRLAFGHLGVELAAAVPLVGTDRHDVIAGLRVAWRP